MILESNALKGVYVLSGEDRAERGLVRKRRQIMEHRTDVMRQIMSKLLFHCIKVPLKGKDRWMKRHVDWLKGLTFEHALLTAVFEILIELFEYVSSQAVILSKQIIAVSRTDKYREKVKLLRSALSFGILRAMECLVELIEIERFKTARELAFYIGLAPSEYSSGQHIHQGRITRCDSKRMRTCLAESSQPLIGKGPAMRLTYMRFKNAKGGERAIIAIARNLIFRMRRVLLYNEPDAARMAA